MQQYRLSDADLAGLSFTTGECVGPSCSAVHRALMVDAQIAEAVGHGDVLSLQREGSRESGVAETWRSRRMAMVCVLPSYVPLAAFSVSSHRLGDVTLSTCSERSPELGLQRTSTCTDSISDQAQVKDLADQV